MIAKLVHEDHICWVSTKTNIYSLDEPFKGHDYIAISVHEVEYGQWQNAGAEVVGCNETGHIVGDSVVPIFQSYVVMSHSDVLAAIGYQLTGEGDS